MLNFLDSIYLRVPCKISFYRHTENPSKKSIKSDMDVQSILVQASKRRHVRNTNMNAVSSRSHAVFTINLGIKHAEEVVRESVIYIVDLAGSECFGKTGSTTGSEAHIEGKCINESLSALKRVISAMSVGQKHIPLRDSLITTYLTSMNCYYAPKLTRYFCH